MTNQTTLTKKGLIISLRKCLVTKEALIFFDDCPAGTVHFASKRGEIASRGSTRVLEKAANDLEQSLI